MASDAEINMNVNIRGASNAAGEMAKLEKMAEFTEKDQYRLEVSTKNRLELIQTIRDLEKSIRDSLQAKDAASLGEYQEKLAVAKEQFEKLNQEEALTQILFAQQMQAGAQLAQNFDMLGSSISGMSKALEDGTLNLTGIGTAIMQMGMAIKSGLGPIAIITGALQIVQTLYNSYAQTKKKVAEAEKENADILAAEKTLYEELATARQNYDAQVQLATSLQNLNAEYDGIKTKLADSLKLIEESTRAEIQRLSIVQDEAEFQRTQERYELGRAFKRGDITDEEYRRRLILLDKEKATAEANKTAAEAQVKLDAATQTAEQKEAVYKSALDSWGTAAQTLKQFTVTEDEINRRQTGIENQQKKAAEIEAQLKKEAEEQGLTTQEVNDLFAAISAGTAGQYITQKAFKPRTNLNVDLLLRLIKNLTDSRGSVANQQAELDSLLGGRSAADYNQARALAVQEEEKRRAEKDAATAESIAAWQAVRGMPTTGEIQAAQQNAVGRANWEANQKILDLENDVAVAKADAERARRLAEATENLQTMSTAQLNAAAKQAQSDAWSENTKDAELAQDLLGRYSDERLRRVGVRKQMRTDLFGDRQFDSAEVTNTLNMAEKAMQENNHAMREIAQYLLRTGMQYTQNAQDLTRIKNKLNEMQ